MSSKPTAHDSGLQRLLDEGYEIQVCQQHLLVHGVPYVAADRTVKLGTIVCKFIENAGVVLPPTPPEDTHQVWWTGEYPCFADGNLISQIENEHECKELLKGCTIQHRFSNKPAGVDNFVSHYDKIVHYVTLLQDQAKVIDSAVDARTRRLAMMDQGTSVFQYEDTASVRAEIVMTSARLGVGKVAIIGIGGTGSYVLDQVAKTPVMEIHLFDGDEFLQHNAFRAPGAATREQIADRMPKVVYFKRMYGAMHRGIVDHPYFLDESNVAELIGFDFVFVCVDRGKARAMICRHLQAQGIPFVDVGMNLLLISSTLKLVGSCRATLCTAQQSDHLAQFVPMDDDGDQVLYRQDIQIADMNALNAQLAVIRWKQHCGFYQDDFHTHNLTFAVNSLSLARDVLAPPKT